MDRDAYGSGLVSDGARDGLANPPRGIRAELIAPLIFELFDRPHQPDISLLDQIQKLESSIQISLGNGDD
jgi:hypothetical protein